MIPKKIYRTPKNFSVCSTRQFLDEVEPIFSLADAKVQGVELDTSLTEKADILGQLLLYKFIEYTIHKNCFQNPKTNLHRNSLLKNGLEETGFLPFVNEFMNKKNSQLKSDIPKDYNLDWKEADTIYIAPIVLSKDSDAYSEKEEEIYKRIRDYYDADSTVVGTIMSCLSEIGSNFMRHAEELTNSVMVARGNKEFFEIACADTGIGAITSIRPVIKEKLQTHEILRKTLEQGVTSKPGTNHSGSGSWLISQYVTFSKGDLYLFSEGAYCHQKKNNYKMGQCGKWKGTIIYVQIPLYDKASIAAGKREIRKQYNHIKITLV
jgi:hypothetical protein